MARRNIFQPPASPPEPLPGEPRIRFPDTGAMSGMKSTLRDLSSNAVREIDPGMIDDDGPRDRLDFTDADIAALTESIRAHGQQVPIMVRPVVDRPGHYRIVFGRRRLRALRLLGRPAKALVRSLSDQQAVLAQGQENSQRIDPSFIEKALFAAELAEAGYQPAVIVDALAIDKPMLSRMSKITRTIPGEAIRRIGPAYGIGRRRWEELADLARDRSFDLGPLAAAALDASEALDFGRALRAARGGSGAATPRAGRGPGRRSPSGDACRWRAAGRDPPRRPVADHQGLDRRASRFRHLARRERRGPAARPIRRLERGVPGGLRRTASVRRRSGGVPAPPWSISGKKKPKGAKGSGGAGMILLPDRSDDPEAV